MMPQGFLWGLFSIQITQKGAGNFSVAEFLLAMALLLILVSYIFRNQHLSKIERYLSFLYVLVYVLPFGVPGGTLLALCTIALLLVLALFSVKKGKSRLFDLILVLAGIRFYILYLQALGGLIDSGLVMLGSGLFLIVAVVLWTKYRKRLTARLERLFSNE